jgi:phospholipid transport system substrate-binding protein
MIGEFVIGRVWLRITPEQKQQYMKLFQELVLKTYGSRLHFYNGEGFQVVNVRVQSAKDTVVNSDITHSDGKTPTPVNWIVRHENGGKLAIIDVSVDGVSQSVTQRDEFASILSQNGEDFNALLKALSQKVQQQSADLPSQGQ